MNQKTHGICVTGLIIFIKGRPFLAQYQSNITVLVAAFASMR